MPKKPIDYSKSIIYKIICNDFSIKDTFVSSTTNFTKKKYQHSWECKVNPTKLYQFIRDNGGWENWTMVMIEEYPCKNSLEQVAREMYWRDKLNATLNVRYKSIYVSKI